jgi:hypothetical protein
VIHSEYSKEFTYTNSRTPWYQGRRLFHPNTIYTRWSSGLKHIFIYSERKRISNEVANILHRMEHKVNINSEGRSCNATIRKDIFVNHLSKTFNAGNSYLPQRGISQPISEHQFVGYGKSESYIPSENQFVNNFLPLYTTFHQSLYCSY